MFLMLLFGMIMSVTSAVLVSSATSVWPGGDDVVNVDKKGIYPDNLSGLYYVSPTSFQWAQQSVLFGVVNSPSTLFKMSFNSTTSNWVPDSDYGWLNGKSLRYPGGVGDPDSEDLTFDDNGVLYVCTERDNDNGIVNKLSILKFENLLQSKSSSSELVATAEWDFTADFPQTENNYAFEGIVWISDSDLILGGLLDESTGKVYDPSIYADHGNGVFFVAHEGMGEIVGYVLQPQGKYSLITHFASGQLTVASLFYDRHSNNDSSANYLWSECDNSSNGKLDVHVLNSKTGIFEIIATYDRPSSLGNFNNEGLTIVPDSECDVKTNLKYVYWSDDDCDDGHCIYRDTLPCTSFI